MQLTHLAIKPDDFGLALVQERDRIGRLTTAGRWVWKHELRFPVEDLALGPQGFAAITTNGGQLQVFDPAGESTVGFTLDPTDPPLLIEAPEGSPAECDLGQPGAASPVAARPQPARRGRLGASDPLGRLVASSPRPLRVRRLGRRPRLGLRRIGCHSRAREPHCEDPTTSFASTADGEPLRISRHGVHLIGATLDGRVRWRAVIDQPAVRSPPVCPASPSCSANRSPGSRRANLGILTSCDQHRFEALPIPW